MNLYVDPIGGLAGSMFIGAFLDLGFPQERLEEMLGQLELPGWRSVRQEVVKQGQRATYFDFDFDVSVPESTLPVGRFAERLPADARRALDLYVEATGWMELPGSETIDLCLDLASFVLARDALGVTRIVCAPLPLSHGTRRHPARARLTRGVPVHEVDLEPESCTATGLALMACLAEFGAAPPPGPAARVGYGAGRSDFPMPNVVRLQLG